MMKLAVWGIGKRCENIINSGYINISDIVAFIDSNRNADMFLGRTVYKPEEINTFVGEIDYIVIANTYYNEILDLLIELNVGLEKVVLTDYIADSGLYESMFLRLKQVSAPLYNLQRTFCRKLIGINEQDIYDNNILLRKNEFASFEYQNDYYRYRTFEFCAKEIKKNNVVGAIAELEVYRGIFARLISEAFPERRFYLFDTFNGFSEEESEIEVIKGHCTEDFVERYRNTSKEFVLKKFKNVENIIICEGLFPDSVSIEAEKEKYAFVSLDVDFELSTYEGIKFFYPRLSENGMIFIHDYNSSHLHGVKEAIAKYELDEGVIMKKIPLADICGTCVIIK